jgi:leader peptidase (prepilin peptidase)/N-methyltransferase
MQDLLSALAVLFRELPWLWVSVVFVLSLLVGSFLNVVIYRLPIMLDRQWRAQAEEILEEEPPDSRNAGHAQLEAAKQTDTKASGSARAPYNLVVPRSACPHCGAQITAWQNIPVVSYLFLKGKCASCGARISLRYPIVELVTAILSALVAWKFGFGWYTAAALVFTWMLIALSGIDIDHHLLPDNMTLPLLWLGLLISLAPASNVPGLPVDPRSSILGATAGYLALWSVYHVFKLLTGKEGMGYGDFKLLAALGAWLGWQQLPLVILLSAFTGAVLGTALIAARRHERGAPIGFGPYLSAAGWIALMWGNDLISAYFQLSGIARS